MWTDSEIFRQDLENILQDKAIPWAELEGKRILVTGATGLIGQTLVSALLFYGMKTSNPPRVLALVRSLDKAKRVFEKQLKDCGENIEFIIGDVCSLPAVEGRVDYIIHGASQTASKAFVEKPVETIETAVFGTKNLLELAREKQSLSFVYLSSMEVYGYPAKGQKVSEEEMGALTTLEVRNCYPLSKQQCECMCCAYAAEYGVPAKIIRLTQTFGPGVSYTDGRVFAEFTRCLIEKRDIVLKTKGETSRQYLYTADAVRAILAVLLKGENGQAYNAANENSFCSILQMAQTVAQMGNIRVKVELQDTRSLGYARTLFMNLNTRKLKNLGWEPNVELPEMFWRMIAEMGK